jgi:predicted peptidase
MIAVLSIFSWNNAEVQEKSHYKYLTYLPPQYKNDETKKWPLIIFLHGASLRGNDPEKIKKFGIPKLISEGKEFGFVIISPQCPSNKDWSTDNWFSPLFEEINSKYRVDLSRVYLTGLSMGGEGTWYIAEQYPEVFAAIAPVCGRSSHIPNIKKEIEKITDLPIWIFHGEKDVVYPVRESDEMFKLLKKNSNVKYTRYPNLGHGATHSKSYSGEELFNWFLDHKKEKDSNRS